MNKNGEEKKVSNEVILVNKKYKEVVEILKIVVKRNNKTKTEAHSTDDIGINPLNKWINQTKVNSSNSVTLINKEDDSNCNNN